MKQDRPIKIPAATQIWEHRDVIRWLLIHRCRVVAGAHPGARLGAALPEMGASALLTVLKFVPSSMLEELWCASGN